MLHQYKQQLISLIANKDVNAIREFFDLYQDPDLARLCSELETADLMFIFLVLPNHLSAQLFSYLEVEDQQDIIEAITDQKLEELLRHLYADDLVDLMDSLPANIVTKILRKTDKEKRGLINQLLNYREETAGALMTVEYVRLKSSWSARESLERIKKEGARAETISYCYVIDEQRKLIGSIRFRDIFFADGDALIKDLMEEAPISVNVNNDQEEVANAFKHYDLTALPVINDDGCLIGIITIDDVLDAIEQEQTEDIHKMAAIIPSEEGYFETPALKMAGHRVVWLLVLMISATVTGAILAGFEHMIAALPILITAIPMLMDTGGNSANQAAAMVIRGIAIGEIKSRDYLRVIRKEAVVALVCGLVLALVNIGRMLVQFLITGATIDDQNVRIVLAMSSTLMLVVFMAKMLGSSLPVIAKKIKLDPAVMAGPVVTTVIDCLALLSYFVFISLYLPGVAS